MALGIFVGLTEAELLGIRDSALADLRKGTTTTGVTFASGNGVSRATTKQVTMPPQEILLEVRYALRALNPETYGRNVSRTFARVSRL
jgi:hypothetical protein